MIINIIRIQEAAVVSTEDLGDLSQIRLEHLGFREENEIRKVNRDVMEKREDVSSNTFQVPG